MDFSIKDLFVKSYPNGNIKLKEKRCFELLLTNHPNWKLMIVGENSTEYGKTLTMNTNEKANLINYQVKHQLIMIGIIISQPYFLKCD